MADHPGSHRPERKKKDNPNGDENQPPEAGIDLPDDLPPVSQEEAEASFGQQSDELAAEQQAAVGGTAPEASEDLDPARLNALADTGVKAIEELTDGQVEVPAPAEVTEPQQMIPPDIFAALATLASFADQFPAASQFKFDPFELGADNAGLAELMSAVGKMGRDTKLQRAIRNQAAPQPEQAETPPAPEKEEDNSRFVPQ